MSGLLVDKDLCMGCGLCVNACPKHIIELASDILNIKGHHPARVVDEEACIACASCAIMCPDCIIKVER